MTKIICSFHSYTVILQIHTISLVHTINGPWQKLTYRYNGLANTEKYIAQSLRNSINKPRRHEGDIRLVYARSHVHILHTQKAGKPFSYCASMVTPTYVVKQQWNTCIWHKENPRTVDSWHLISQVLIDVTAGHYTHMCTPYTRTPYTHTHAHT